MFLTVSKRRDRNDQHREYHGIIRLASEKFAFMIFAIGMKYALLKIMMTFVFSDIEYLPEYGFDFKALAITLVLFVVSYEAVMFFWTRKLGKTSVKSVMAE